VAPQPQHAGDAAEGREETVDRRHHATARRSGGRLPGETEAFTAARFGIRPRAPKRESLFLRAASPSRLHSMK
jgi:hypothetical protein